MFDRFRIYSISSIYNIADKIKGISGVKEIADVVKYINIDDMNYKNPDMNIVLFVPQPKLFSVVEFWSDLIELIKNNPNDIILISLADYYSIKYYIMDELTSFSKEVALAYTNRHIGNFSNRFTMIYCNHAAKAVLPEEILNHAHNLLASKIELALHCKEGSISDESLDKFQQDFPELFSAITSKQYVEALRFGKELRDNKNAVKSIYHTY